MNKHLVSSLVAGLAAYAFLACSGSPPAPAAPSDTAAPAASASDPVAPSAASTAAASAAPSAAATGTASAAPSAPAAPADPLLAGLTGGDLEWAQKCLGGNGSYCTSPGNVAEMQTKDFAKAMAWYKKGCEAQMREPVCCMGVARLTINGQGTAADVEAGLKIWEETCSMELGRDSCSELGRAYERGAYGVKKDAKKAKEIYAKACDLRNETACKKAGKKPPADK